MRAMTAKCSPLTHRHRVCSDGADTIWGRRRASALVHPLWQELSWLSPLNLPAVGSNTCTRMLDLSFPLSLILQNNLISNGQRHAESSSPPPAAFNPHRRPRSRNFDSTPPRSDNQSSFLWILTSQNTTQRHSLGRTRSLDLCC
jgi:hypothetical protein